MAMYALTVYEKDGSKLLDEQFEAPDDQQARFVGESKLVDLGLSEKTSRVTSPAGKLVSFHR